MRIFYRTGIELSAGSLRQLMPGHSDHGETSPADLVRLMRVFKLSPVARPLGLDAVENGIRRSVEKLVPPIVLGRWLSDTTLHWVLGVGASDVGLLVNDPWDGRRRQYTWDLVASRYAGWVVL